MAEDQLRLAEPLAALSLVTDLGMGQDLEKAVRGCVVATALARRMDVPEREVSDVYYTTLLRHLGCTATAHEEAYLFGGDQLASRPPAERADFGNRREALGLLLSVGRGAGADRVRYLSRALRAGKEADRAIIGALCEVAARVADRLGMTAGVRDGVAQVFERWDGTGGPAKLAGDQIALPARLAEIGHQAVIIDRLGGAEAAVETIRRRAGGWLDPGACETFARHGREILGEVAAADAWTAVLDAEPRPRRTVGPAHLDRVAEAFADLVDLQAPFMLGHSREVAGLAARAAASIGLPEEEVVAVRRASLLHDLGRVGVSNGIWEKPGPLTAAEWERVRLHPYHTERILARSAALEPLARLAGMHHERLDASGYHRGASAAEIPVPARLIAVADAYQARTQRRPHRPAMSPDEAAKDVAEGARSGLFDPDCTRAIVDAAGRRPPTLRGAWPAGLSDREVEVLRLVAAGLSNREIGKRLFVSPRTAEHHVQHIYAKIGISTRAGAAMFAMEHGLLRD